MQTGLIARLRWQIFVNSLRTVKGRLEIFSKIMIGIVLGGGILSAGIGLGVASYFLVHTGREEFLPGIFWVIFFFWQGFPVMSTAFGAPFDFAELLRYPLRYTSFFLVVLAYGMFDPAALGCCYWLACIVAGVSLAQPALFPVTALLALVFAAVNLLLARAILAWLDRWLAQRKTREILGVVFFVFIIGLQFINPLVQRLNGHLPASSERLLWLAQVQRFFPPGLAGTALDGFVRGERVAPFFNAVLLCVYGLVFFWLLELRLRKQFAGESFGESIAPVAMPAAKRGSVSVAGWNLRGLSGSLAAVVEKEVRYLSRSGPMLLTFVMPIFILVLFKVSPARGGQQKFLTQLSDLAFPIAAAYALLVLTNVVYNSLGADDKGIQFFLFAPVRFRDVLRGKNIAHSVLLVLEMVLVFAGASLLYRPPSPAIVAATLTGVLFAALANFSAGNLMSVQFPKRIDYSALGRQRLPGLSVIISMTVQLLAMGICAAVFFISHLLGHIWLSALVLLVLAAAVFPLYLWTLRQGERVVLEKRDALLAEVAKS
ncbi:MAG: hypothetical protein ACRD50_09430 [Candidatus Acidiferrales bacterium]